MARRLYLHIGMMKSGTTYIQNVCNQNARALEDNGLKWMLGAYSRQAAAVGEFRHSGRVMPGLEGSWSALKKEMRAHDGDALVSFELLTDLRERQVARFVHALPADEVHVIVTARDISRVLPSLWQESTQNCSTTRWAEYLETACDETGSSQLKREIDLHTDYAEALRKWSTVVPSERLHLITVPPSSAGPDELWHRFASVIGAPNDIARPERSNPTIGAVSSELMIRLNERVAGVDWPIYQLGFKHGLAKRALTKRATEEPRVGFPQDRWDWVENRARRMVEEVVELGPDVVGDLADLAPVRSSSGVDPDWSPSDAELLAAARLGLRVLGRQLTRLGEAPAADPVIPARGSESVKLAYALDALEARGRRLGELRVGQWIDERAAEAPAARTAILLSRARRQAGRARRRAGTVVAAMRRRLSR